VGGEFEEGAYQSDQNGEKIDIYHLINQAKLIRVLAHELGHAHWVGTCEDSKRLCIVE